MFVFVDVFLVVVCGLVMLRYDLLYCDVQCCDVHGAKHLMPGIHCTSA